MRSMSGIGAEALERRIVWMPAESSVAITTFMNLPSVPFTFTLRGAAPSTARSNARSSGDE